MNLISDLKPSNFREFIIFILILPALLWIMFCAFIYEYSKINWMAFIKEKPTPQDSSDEVVRGGGE